MRHFMTLSAVAATALAIAACDDEAEPGPAAAATKISLTVEGLVALSPGQGAYEGWLIYGDEKVSTGVFNDTAATMTIDRDARAADKFVVTIEPTPDSDPAPSGVVVLAGDIAGNGATLAFGADLSSASGGFILRTPTDDATNARHRIDLTLTGLEPLRAGAYEGWLIFGADKVSTGTFTDVAAVTMYSDRDPAGADKFVLTIEPSPDADPGPSGIIALAGDIPAGAASAALAFDADLSTASGGYILRTPTDDAAGATTNDSSGVWFVNVPGPVAGLTLPALPSGWVYEGWGVTQGVPLSTGRFTDAGAADLASPYSDGGPPFPGEDFLTDLPAQMQPPVDLADGNSMVVISVEPDLAGVDPTGDGPFAIKPLAADVPMGLAGATFSQLGVGPVVSISGTATFSTEPIDNDSAGVWFLKMPGPIAGLSLPALPSGWVYEGWAVTQGTPLSSGRFTDAAAADLGSPYSDGGPPFPGEDFLTNLPASITAPVDLADGASKIVVSVEPDIAGADPTGDGPFALKPLAIDVPAGLVAATFTNLAPGPVTEATGSVTFE